MQYSELKLLLLKYKENRCTCEELRRLQIYFSDKNNEAGIKEGLLDTLESFVPVESKINPDFDVLFTSIASKINVESQIVDSENFTLKPGKNLFLRFLKVAAVLVPVFLAGGILSQLIFTKTTVKESVTYNIIKAPYGARSEIILADGSSVWLNSGSILKYTNVFNKENRDVYLEGEAYFKVARNKEIPFNVRAGDLNIEALGTEFNVKSYEEEGIIETTLLEGRISISQNSRQKSTEPVFLEPHQKAVYIRDKSRLDIEDLKAAKIIPVEIPERKESLVYVAKEIDTEPIIAWKENKLIFKGEELSNLLVKLERKYDVQFIFASENIKKFRFSGTLDNETLTQVLDVIKLSAPIEYSLEGKTVRISENKKMMEKFSTHLKTK